MKQAAVLLILTLIAALYFVSFIFPNATGAANAHMLSLTSQDESFQYPFLMRMLTPGNTLSETLTHIISYHHYIYGYPFYVVSGLVSLPLRIIYGDQLSNHVQLHLTVLRQMVSVLPMALTILILVYLQTRFQSLWRSILLFLLLATLPGIVRQNISWWHPDALAILAAMLVFFFLDRDHLRFGRNFYFAAIACGTSAGTKLIGFLFFLTIASYLTIGLIQKYLSVKKAFLSAILFIIVLVATVVALNPLLMVPDKRAEIIQTHLSHNESFRSGWENSDQYTRNPLTWLPVLKRWYGGIAFLAFALISLIAGTLSGPRRLHNLLILTWIVPYAIYLLTTIAVRPDHYWMPVILPLVSGSLTFTEIQVNPPSINNKRAFLKAALPIAFFVLSILVTAGQTVLNLKQDIPLYIDALNQEKILTACDSEPVNQPDGKVTSLDNEIWYLVMEYDTLQAPPVRKFFVRQGKDLENVKASPQQGRLVWACRNKALAELRADKDARDYQLSHPATVVIGPNEVPLP